jgi:rSAM/selenodomain-associated transferase 2
MPEPGISIIVPTLDEAAGISRMLAQLQPLRRQGHEIIVVDGGSRDATWRLAEDHVDQLILSRPGRARQMNAGAHLARGDVFWFLHADTRLPAGAGAALTAAWSQHAQPSWGRFDVRIESGHPLLQLVAGLMNLRSRLTGIATGDQGLFVSRSLFEAVGGYPQQALMEDIELSRRLKRCCSPVCLHTRLVVSARRWHQQGVIRTILTMWWLRLSYFFGARPEVLAALYNRGRA